MATVGYGDITPTNTSEVLLCVFTMLITCGVFANVLNTIGVIFEDLGMKRKLIN